MGISSSDTVNLSVLVLGARLGGDRDTQNIYLFMCTVLLVPLTL